MSQRYILTAPDGEELQVEPSQAGEVLTTASGQQVEVPTLRELRKLPMVESESKPPERTWSMTQGTLFGAGFFLVIAGSIATVFLYRLAPQSPDELIVKEELIRKDVGEYSTRDMLGFWEFATDPRSLKLLRDRAEMERQYIESVNWWRGLFSLSIGGTVLGLVMIGSSMLMRGARIDAVPPDGHAPA